MGPKQIDHGEADDEPEADDQPLAFDRFRHMKHGVIWFLLAPSVILAPVFLVALMIAWLVHVLTSR